LDFLQYFDPELLYAESPRLGQFVLLHGNIDPIPVPVAGPIGNYECSVILDM
jgi:hypothetical protein